jgi:hypothetical protein
MPAKARWRSNRVLQHRVRLRNNRVRIGRHVGFDEGDVLAGAQNRRATHESGAEANSDRQRIFGEDHCGVTSR